MMMKMIKMVINPASIRNEAQPVLNLYYNQAQSSQHPKRGTGSTTLVLQSSTIQPASTKPEIPTICPIPIGQSKISIPDGEPRIPTPARLPLVIGQSKISIPDREPRIPKPARLPSVTQKISILAGETAQRHPGLPSTGLQTVWFATELWPPTPISTFAKLNPHTSFWPFREIVVSEEVLLLTPKSGLVPRAVGLKLYFNPEHAFETRHSQYEPSQHPKRGTASTKLVQQSSTTQPASETKHCQYSSTRLMGVAKDDGGDDDDGDDDHHPSSPYYLINLVITTIKHNPGSIRNEALASTTIKHNPASIRNEALPILNLYYNQAQSRQHQAPG